MLCSNCGKKIDKNSKVCASCGKSVSHYRSILLILVSILLLGSVLTISVEGFSILDSFSVKDSKVNIELNSNKDITNEVIDAIINNSIGTLTINYEFTKGYNAETDNYAEFKKWELQNNPFKIANEKQPLKEINFRIVLGDKVTSTANMFSGDKELRSVTNFNTRNITDMQMMFYEAWALEEVPSFDTKNVVNMKSILRI